MSITIRARISAIIVAALMGLIMTGAASIQAGPPDRPDADFTVTSEEDAVAPTTESTTCSGTVSATWTHTAIKGGSFKYQIVSTGPDGFSLVEEGRTRNDGSLESTYSVSTGDYAYRVKLLRGKTRVLAEDQTTFSC